MENFIEYDKESDSLVLRKTGEGVIESINDRDICILDLNREKQIVGLEFLDVSKTFNIPLQVLRNIKQTKVNIRYDHIQKLIYINVLLVYEEKEKELLVPVSADLGDKDFMSHDFIASASA